MLKQRQRANFQHLHVGIAPHCSSAALHRQQVSKHCMRVCAGVRQVRVPRPDEGNDGPLQWTDRDGRVQVHSTAVQGRRVCVCHVL